MGAQNFSIVGYGTSAREVFEGLVQDAEYEYGHDSYNGTISTCSLGRMKKVADKYTKSVDGKAHKIIEDEDYGVKWEARVLDLGVVRYELYSAKKVAHKAKKVAEYRQRFVILNLDSCGREKMVSHFATKKEADDEALRLIAQYPKNDYVVAKRSINVNRGDDVVTEFKTETKVRASKPKTIPKGSILREVHKYIFYGWAAC